MALAYQAFIENKSQPAYEIKGLNNQITVERKKSRIAMIKHVVVTPIRDEESFLPSLFQSMIRQTVRPSIWVLVDDFSTDASVELIEREMEKHEWITLLRNHDSGPRKRGSRIASIFNLGKEHCGEDWEYISKIDGDMALPDDYFEKIFGEFEADRKLGIASGNCRVTGSKKIEAVEKDHTRGGLKTYRKECLSDIGGVFEVDGWDGLDNSIAQQRGWRTRNFLEIVAQHKRKTGEHEGLLVGFLNAGKKSHIMGYRWSYLVAKSLVSMKRWPYVIGGTLILSGFVLAKISRVPQFHDKEVIRFIRLRQKERIMKSIIGRGFQ